MANGYVLVAVNFTGGTVQTAASIERGTSAIGPWTMLDESVPLLGERAYYYDAAAPVGEPVWYRVVSGAETQTLGPYTDTDTGTVWLKDPLRPWASLELGFCDTATVSGPCGPADPLAVWAGFDSETWTMDAGLFPVLNSEHPADVFARRKHAEGAFRILTRSLEAKTQVYDLFTAGGPLYLQLPAEYGWADAYIQPHDVNMSYISRDQRRPERLWQVPFTIVDAVTGPAQGTACANWCAVDEAYTTFAAMTAAGGDWGTVASGQLLCPTEPPVPDGFGMGGFGSGPFGDPS